MHVTTAGPGTGASLSRRSPAEGASVAPQTLVNGNIQMTFYNSSQVNATESVVETRQTREM